MYKERFGLIYGALAFVVLLAGLGAYKAFSIRSPSHVAHQSDIAALAEQVKAVAGDQDLIAQCEANITQTVKNNYGQVRGYTVLKVYNKGSQRIVKLKVGSTIYDGTLYCSFHKSNWQLLNVKTSA